MTEKTWHGKCFFLLMYRSVILPELGIVGVILYFGMVLFSFKDLKYILKLKRDNKYLSIPVQNQNKDKSWIVNKMRFISLDVVAALVGYLFAFISVLYYFHSWVLIAKTVAIRNVAEKKVGEFQAQVAEEINE